MDNIAKFKNIMEYAASIFDLNAKLRRLEAESGKDTPVYKACLLKYKMLSDEETAYYNSFLKNISDVAGLKNFMQEIVDKTPPVVAMGNDLITKRTILGHVLDKCSMIFNTNYLKLYPLEPGKDPSKDQMECARDLLKLACAADVFNYSRVSVYEYARKTNDKELINWVTDDTYYFLYSDAISSLYNFGFSHDLTGNYLVGEKFTKEFNIPYVDYFLTLTDMISNTISDYSDLIFSLPSDTKSFEHLMIKVASIINLWPEDEEFKKNNISVGMSKEEMLDIFYRELYEALQNDKKALEVIEDVWKRKEIKMRKLK